MPAGNGPGCRGRALVTNDDGVHSDGLHALAEAADAMGMEVLVVAPSFDASGSSASMTVMASDGRVVVENLTDRTGRAVLGVHGPPAFIVRAAMYGAFGAPPDVVLSGVNRGHNTGRAVLHSGTVGAALTAATYGRRGLAISAGADGNGPWDPSSPFTKSAISWLLACPEATVLNVNIPATGGGPPKGVRSTTLAECGTVQGNVTEVTGNFVPVTFHDEDGRPAAGTDAAALADGFVSVTAIRAATLDPSVPLDELLVAARTP
jgi:5'-nucleotidase